MTHEGDRHSMIRVRTSAVAAAPMAATPMPRESGRAASMMMATMAPCTLSLHPPWPPASDSSAAAWAPHHRRCHRPPSPSACPAACRHRCRHRTRCHCCYCCYCWSRSRCLTTSCCRCWSRCPSRWSCYLSRCRCRHRRQRLPCPPRPDVPACGWALLQCRRHRCRHPWVWLQRRPPALPRWAGGLHSEEAGAVCRARSLQPAGYWRRRAHHQQEARTGLHPEDVGDVGVRHLHANCAVEVGPRSKSAGALAATNTRHTSRRRLVCKQATRTSATEPTSPAGFCGF